jgi:DNA recombination protein RmuC
MTNKLPIMEIAYLALGIFLGALLAWLVLRQRFASEYVSEAKLQESYVHKSLYDSLQVQADLLRDDLLDKEQEIRALGGIVAAKEQNIIHLEIRLEQQAEDLAKTQVKLQTEFENIANRIMEEKSQRFTAQNQQQLSGLLQPLHLKIKEFEEGVERKYWDEAKERVSLRKEIEQLRELNTRLSNDADRLVRALKGDNKTQGDWGELRLEILLERAGLEKDLHFRKQETFRDEGDKALRPDFIINLPDEKHLVVDSKMSLKDFEGYINAATDEEKTIHLKAHIISLRNHIKDLGSKNYQNIYNINTPDYVLMFVPVEPAFAIAVQNDQQLFLDALDRNVVVVTSSTLLATMRTVSYIWKQEKQKRNALEIARQSGLLYDKFCAFVDDLKSVGKELDQAKMAYNAAFNKLSDAKHFGGTLIGRAERLRELGAKATKALPPDLLDDETTLLD